jgi:UDP-4-amino-4,6-dideoxy-N-acetyl-beta-L-altrosamine transaminase
MIPYGRQDITQDDIDAVIDVLQSEFLTQGTAVPAFEKAISTYCRTKYAVATNSATSALHLACLALGVGTGDLIWSTSITFVSSLNCALYCGAKVDFVDIDSKNYTLSVELLEEKLVQAKKKGALPKVVIPVHLCGQSCDMVGIYNLSLRYGFKIIEDAAHALGGKYQNEPIGNCRYSDITIFSFHPVKIITTGEGGMALTNNQDIADKMLLLRSHGITRDSAQMTKPSDGPWYYQQIDLGFNYRMTELQAALGISQMARLDDYVKRRHVLAGRYAAGLSELPVTLPWQHPDNYSAVHLYVIRLQLDNIEKTHRQVFEELREEGIGVNLHYIPVHTQPYYQRMGFENGDFPEAEKYYSEAISLPMYPTLSEREQDTVMNVLQVVLK